MDERKLKAAFEAIRREVHPFIAVANIEWYSLFKDEIRNSIAIEGIFANRKELLDVLERNKRTSDQKMAAILGYFESAGSLYDYANNLYNEQEFQLRIADIRQIHTLLMRYESQLGTFQGTVGRFRRENVEVADAGFQPLDAAYIPEMMGGFVQWINAQMADPQHNPLRLAAASHVLFETIHPFKDGNGRVGRILLNFLLIGEGYANIAIKGVQKNDRERYYEALAIGDDGFDRMLRMVEVGLQPTPDLIDDHAQQSDLAAMEEIIVTQLETSLTRLKKHGPAAFNQDDLVPLRQAAQFSNYSQDYLRNLINLGKLPAQKRGKLWYMRIRDLSAYMQQQSGT